MDRGCRAARVRAGGPAAGALHTRADGGGCMVTAAASNAVPHAPWACAGVGAGGATAAATPNPAAAGYAEPAWPRRQSRTGKR
eukprot:11165505-Lingulodinium_polyedra.AAC.1